MERTKKPQATRTKIQNKVTTRAQRKMKTMTAATTMMMEMML